MTAPTAYCAACRKVVTVTRWLPRGLQPHAGERRAREMCDECGRSWPVGRER